MITFLKSNTTIDSVDNYDDNTYHVEVTNFQNLSDNFSIGTDYVIEVTITGEDELEIFNDSYGVADSTFVNNNAEDVLNFKYAVYDMSEDSVYSHLTQKLKEEIEKEVSDLVVEKHKEEMTKQFTDN